MMARAARFVACLLLAVTAVAAAQGGEVVTFARAVELAATGSSVTAAEAQLELARLSLQSALYPVSASASGGATTSTDFTGQGTSLALDLSLNASLRVGWGATAEAAAAAQRSLEAAAAAVETARADAVQQAVRLYSEALAATTTRDVAQLQLEVASLQAEAARSRLEAGAALTTDVAQAELSEKSAELDLKAAEAALAAAYTDLSLALGVNITGVAVELPDGRPVGAGAEGGASADSAAAGEPATSPAEASVGAGSIGTTVTDDALAARADVRAARRDLAAAVDSLAQARRAAGINISANASVSTSSGATSVSLGASMDTRDQTPALTSRLSTSTSSAGGGGSDATWRASLGVSASVPLGPPDTRVASAEVAYEQAQARLAQVIASARVEATALRAQVEADAARLQVAESRAGLARSADETAQARFELGVIGQADVIQARVGVLQADGQVRTAKLNYLLDLMALARATGNVATEVLR